MANEKAPSGRQYRLNSPHQLRIKGQPAGADAIYLSEDTIVGEGTDWDFEGPPTPSMTPLNHAAEKEHVNYMDTLGAPNASLKDYRGPDAGGAAPFDSAAADTEKEQLKKDNEELKAQIKKLEDAAKANTPAANSTAQGARPAGVAK